MAQSEDKGGILSIDYSEMQRMLDSMGKFQRGGTEDILNDVLHNYAGDRAQEDIVRLMPVSSKKTGAHAKYSNSLRNVLGNLSVTVATKGNFGYLYFPDDGTNTRRHVGNQRFFERGGDAAMNDIVERCVTRLTTEFEKGV